VLNPDLIEEIREDLAEIDLARQPDLARLRDALLDSGAPVHAKDELIAHLGRLGLAQLVKDITSWRLMNDYQNPASKSPLEPREIWKSMRTGLLDKSSLDAELAKAANEHAAEMTPRSEARLYAVRRQAGLARGADPLPSTPPNQDLKKSRA
jgi:hypothetical protein